MLKIIVHVPLPAFNTQGLSRVENLISIAAGVTELAGESEAVGAYVSSTDMQKPDWKGKQTATPAQRQALLVKPPAVKAVSTLLSQLQFYRPSSFRDASARKSILKLITQAHTKGKV